MPLTRHTVLGIMSGSSLDGIDLAICDFDVDPASLQIISDWAIRAATTLTYSAAWKQRLRDATNLAASDLWQLHADLGNHVGEQARRFLADHPNLRPTLAGCHGHTVFHEPARGYSVQIGEGSHIARHLRLPVVTDLRTADIAAGGEGAPLAPVADRYLFPKILAFLNLGGIANFSLRSDSGQLIAGDVTGCCQILDRLAAREQLPYDEDGKLARAGRYSPELVAQLGALPFHQAAYPKSLSNDWVVKTLWPVVDAFPATTPDLLHTFTCWLAEKIMHDMQEANDTLGGGAGAVNLLVSGGGARNTFLTERLSLVNSTKDLFAISAVEGMIGDFKEAALVALCALFRQLGIPNSLAAATGATHDTINGALYAA